MAEYYECHITINQSKPREDIKRAVEELGWKFSAIDGDPIMGKKVYCYATKHFKSSRGKHEVISELMAVSAQLKASCEVLRNKVEMVLFDDRAMSYAACPNGVTL